MSSRHGLALISMMTSLAAQASISLEAAHLFESVSNERRRFETVLRTVPFGVAVCNADCTDVRLNPAGAAIFGIAADANLADEAVYAGTKFAQVGLAGSLDRELREDGIRVTAICPAGVHTEFAMGTGRTEDDPELASYLRPEDVAHAIVSVLRQPRRVRTTLWALWSMGQGS